MGVQLYHIFTTIKSRYSTKSSIQIDQETLELQKKLYKEQLIRQAMAKRGSKFYPVHLEPFAIERNRLASNITSQDRALRKQWLEDQVLSPREPVEVPEWNRVNIFRRVYRWPYDKLTNLLRPVLGHTGSEYFRFVTPKAVAIYLVICVTWYHLKYTHKDWSTKRGMRMDTAYKPSLYPGQADFYDKPRLEQNHGMEDFEKRATFLGDKLVTSGP